MLNKIDQKAALSMREAATLIPGFGYVRVGKPALPAQPIYPPSACTPPAGTPDGTVLEFTAKEGAVTAKMVWNVATRTWAPTSVLIGNRLAFSPAYLAAFGWKLL